MRVVRGRVFYRGRLESLDLGIESGRFASIKKNVESRETIDYGERIILPGAIDLHVHMREPGLTEKEDFPSGTRCAALGGVTTVVDMPNTIPAVSTADALSAKRKILQGRSSVDYGLFGAPRISTAVPDLAAADAFKAYMAPSTGDLAVGEDALSGVIREVGAQGKILAVHAEDPRWFKRASARGLEGHSVSRPIESEVHAIETVATNRGHTAIHIAHVTCVAALDAVPSGMSTEVTPHHLFLDFLSPSGGLGKVNPPLRSPGDRRALWDAFRGGRIDLVASDHAPHTHDEKTSGPFDEIPSGMPGVATSLPLLLRQVRSQELGLDRLVSALATKPAEMLHLKKGRIEVGYDADMVVVDPRQVEKITSKRLGYKCGWTAFEGFEGIFPEAVYLRGEPILEEGETIVEGAGRPIHLDNAS